ncbi:MAG: hypothetical protein AAF648_00350 [Pseudomonadota bacterium]
MTNRSHRYRACQQAAALFGGLLLVAATASGSPLQVVINWTALQDAARGDRPNPRVIAPEPIRERSTEERLIGDTGRQTRVPEATNPTESSGAEENTTGGSTGSAPVIAGFQPMPSAPLAVTSRLRTPNRCDLPLASITHCVGASRSQVQRYARTLQQRGLHGCCAALALTEQRFGSPLCPALTSQTRPNAGCLP